MDSRDTVFISELVRDARVSLRDLAAKTGLSYTSVRERLYRLRERGLIQFKPMVSPVLYGRVAAVVEFTGRNMSSLAEELSMCNRVLFVMELNGSLVAGMAARSPAEILLTIEHFVRRHPGVSGYSVKYGKIPRSLYIPLKCSTPRCVECGGSAKHESICSGCLPRPRIKG